MKCTIPEISWHNRDPVLSVDVQPLTNEDFYRLASGGTDTHVLIWHLKIIENGATVIEPVCDLNRHEKAVNVVRWSPNGQYLASGDDDAIIILWHQKADDLAIMLNGDDADKEKWSSLKTLRGHKEDVYDICWSPDSTKLISGSVDNTAIIWDFARGLNDNILTDHKGFVQGVSWDPLGQWLVTLSSDRVFRVFTVSGNKVKARISKGTLPVSESHPLHEQTVRYFHDDTLKTFFRRLTFSPDGNLILTPAGFLEAGSNNKKLYVTYIFATSNLTQPSAIIPSPGQYTIAVKFCPILFQLKPDGPEPAISLPYRMIFAIASRSSVILYDTQQMSPFGIISNIHYTRLTDITWSQDGRLLAVSSTDGFCSLITFEPNELGVEYVKETVEQEVCDLNDTCEEIAETSLNTSVDKQEKKPSFLQQWTKKAKTENEENMDVDDDVIMLEPDEKENKRDNVIIGASQQEEKVEQIKSDNKTKLIKTEKRNSSPAKPIAVRRKPRDQMNITQFLKQPKPVSQSTPSKTKTKEVLKPAPVPIPEDSLPREPWSLDNVKTEECKNEETHSETENSIIIPSEIIEIEDSQDMQLVLEDTQSSKMEVDKDEKLNKTQEELKTNETKNEEKSKSEEISKDANKKTKTNSSKKKINKKSQKKDNEIKQKNVDIKTNESEVTSSNKNLKCDTNATGSDSEDAKKVPIVCLSPLPNKKRVNLITLSSPKLKKKPF